MKPYFKCIMSIFKDGHVTDVSDGRTYKKLKNKEGSGGGRGNLIF